LGVHLLARFITTLVDIAQLSLPNKLAGLFFGALRQVFTLSVVFNLFAGCSRGGIPPREVCEASTLHAPVQAFAPLLVPALNGTKWVNRAVDEVRRGMQDLVND